MTRDDRIKEATEQVLQLDLRDYFAAKAMQALITRETRLIDDPMVYADAAYDVADAMLKARGEK